MVALAWVGSRGDGHAVVRQQQPQLAALGRRAVYQPSSGFAGTPPTVPAAVGLVRATGSRSHPTTTSTTPAAQYDPVHVRLAQHTRLTSLPGTITTFAR